MACRGVVNSGVDWGLGITSMVVSTSRRKLRKVVGRKDASPFHVVIEALTPSGIH